MFYSCVVPMYDQTAAMLRFKSATLFPKSRIFSNFPTIIINYVRKSNLEI